MNLLKSTSLLFTTILLSACAISQPAVHKGQTEDLYKGIEYKMPRVQEPVIPKNSVSITDFGAKSGGQELCSRAFTDAINAVSEKGGGRIIIPRGTWLTGPITLKSNIELRLQF